LFLSVIACDEILKYVADKTFLFSHVETGLLDFGTCQAISENCQRNTIQTTKIFYWA